MFRRFMEKYMMGRNGPDHLGTALFVVSVIFFLLGNITGLGIFMTLAYIAVIYGLFRMLSRNIQKRRRENDRFLTLWAPVRQKFRARMAKIKSMKDYKFFKCPSCGNTLRVPKHKGKIMITCPKCGERFEKKT